MLGVALDGHDVDGFGLVRVDVDGEAEVGGQVAADFVPGVAGIVAAHDVPVLLHEEHVGARRVHGDAVNAVADLGVGVGDALRTSARELMGRQVLPPSSVRKAPAAEMAMKMRLGLAGIEQDGVQAHAAGAGLPAGSGAVAAQAGQFVPGLCRRRWCGTGRRPPRRRKRCRDR